MGTTDPTTPATGILGLAGMVLFGAVGLLDKIIVLGCIPVGAMGMARLTRPLGTAWARVTSTVIYLAIPVPYDALATGHWDALVMYAACPWIVHLLAQASRVDPYGARRWRRRRSGGSSWFKRSALPVASNGSVVRTPHEAREVGAADGAKATGAAIHASRHWRHSLVGWTLALGLLDAFVTALAPSAALVTLVVALGLALGNVVTQGSAGVRAAGRVAGCALGATAVAVVLLAPWSFAVLGGPERWQTLAGVPVTAASGAGWGELLRLAVGPIGDAALAWAFLAAAALPLLIGAAVAPGLGRSGLVHGGGGVVRGLGGGRGVASAPWPSRPRSSWSRPGSASPCRSASGWRRSSSTCPATASGGARPPRSPPPPPPWSACSRCWWAAWAVAGTSSPRATARPPPG